MSWLEFIPIVLDTAPFLVVLFFTCVFVHIAMGVSLIDDWREEKRGKKKR